MQSGLCYMSFKFIFTLRAIIVIEKKNTLVFIVLTGKDKATISVSRKCRIAKLLQANSTSDFDGKIVYHEKKYLNMHH